MPAVDWDHLRRAAREVTARAYAPYSGFPVGAAGLASDGRVVTGCNVENASTGLSLCAECGVICGLRAGGDGHLVAIACVDASGADLVPCGRCRQLLHEHGGPHLLVNGLPLARLLPEPFGPEQLGVEPPWTSSS